MKKISSLFKRDYEGNRQVYNEVVGGSKWVLNGEGTPTVKLDGTCCKIEDGVLYKRYDRKLSKNAMQKLKKGGYIPKIEDYKQAPEGWQSAEKEPNEHTGHWPGWLPVNENASEDKYHTEAFRMLCSDNCFSGSDGTYELVGEKVQGNPYKIQGHQLIRHGEVTFDQVPRNFDDLKDFLSKTDAEGIVWHHPDGRMVKIKRRDFGLEWPLP